ncbi:MAG: hypothetical protein Q9218_000938, partial [Villophora microphyllina]
MGTPSTVSSAGYLASASSGAPSTPWSASRPPSTPSSGSSAKRFLQGAGSPPPSGTAKGFLHRNRDLSSNIIAGGYGTPRYQRPEDIDYPLSPDAKRRRVMGLPYAVVQRTANGPPTPFAFPRHHEPLPRPDFMNSPTFTMGPPPHPHSTHHQPKSSLTLPPLQKISLSGDSTQSKSVKAMVMSIPPLNKIRMLSKIARPLPNPSPASPAFETRGFIIAIDGQEAAAVEQITAYLNTVFTPSHAVKVFQPPVTAEESKESGTEENRVLSIEDCHLNMAKYLTLSSQVKSYVTTSPLSYALTNSSPPVSPKSMPVGSDTAHSPSTDVEMTDRPSAAASGPSSSTTPCKNPAVAGPRTPITPIALVPSYLLTHTDLFACRVPIEDNYAPTEHWTWMANMWRGIVGPDITIAVRGYDAGSGAVDSA